MPVQPPGAEPGPERNRVVYVTSDGTGRWLVIDIPFGLITPPTITIHEPLTGPVEFFYAECFGLLVPAEARAAVSHA